ncbi:DNA-binding protein [Geobacter pelophilus]|uniref:DNA-binding protein n=1 Tax=Geoanaerobacter pelophilus TaxID=60036 RepID=A0AAW4L995_9BACT|nr:CLJU_RS11820 family redox protein [Geoanaerobacter pelophilus]MBT0665140.1 DNA-binding protein [Geoanaerobacter pelophilus]
MSMCEQDPATWSCDRCAVALVPGKVEFSYMGGSFKVDLPVCPDCGLVLVPEELAVGRMADAEKILEDK